MNEVGDAAAVPTVIVGAAGRDFHNFNVVYREDPSTRVVAFTAAQIPGIAGRRYPPSLAGPLYPSGIPIEDESRLESLGLRPGQVDGVLDDDSRRAIRRYQSARNLPETGYLSEAVVVQLLADSVRQIFR